MARISDIHELTHMSVAWEQGMLLHPQHFQQQERHVNYVIDQRIRAVLPWAWGFSVLKFDPIALQHGKLGLLEASGIFEDGTPFIAPGENALPEPLEVTGSMVGDIIELRLANEPAVSWVGPGMTAQAQDDGRYIRLERALQDQHAVDDDAEIVGLKAGRLVLQPASESKAGWNCIPTARLSRSSEGKLTLDEGFIPCQFRIDATSRLLQDVKYLLNYIVEMRDKAIGRIPHATGGSVQAAELLVMLVLNRAEIVFRRLGEGWSHPRELHEACGLLAAELAALISTERIVKPGAAYDHVHPSDIFPPAFERVRLLLAATHVERALAVQLKDMGNYRHLGTLPVKARGAKLVLAITSSAPVQVVRRAMEASAKVAPERDLEQLISQALPGLPLRLCPSPPPELPNQFADTVYLLIERDFSKTSGREYDLWTRIDASGGIAVSIPKQHDLQKFELVLWAIPQIKE